MKFIRNHLKRSTPQKTYVNPIEDIWTSDILDLKDYVLQIIDSLDMF